MPTAPTRLRLGPGDFLPFGDMLRVPPRGDLLQPGARGPTCRVVYSLLDAANLAAANPQRQVVFAIGFETTAPNARYVWMAKNESSRTSALMTCSCRRSKAILEAGQSRRAFGLATFRVMAIANTSLWPRGIACRSGSRVRAGGHARAADDVAAARMVAPRWRTSTAGRSAATVTPFRFACEDVFEVCDRAAASAHPASGYRRARYREYDAPFR